MHLGQNRHDRNRSRSVELNPSEFDADYDDFRNYIGLNSDRDIYQTLSSKFPGEIDAMLTDNRDYEEFFDLFASFIDQIPTNKYDAEGNNDYVSADFYHLATLVPENRNALPVIVDMFFVLCGVHYGIAIESRNRTPPPFEVLLYDSGFLEDAKAYYITRNNIAVDVTDRNILNKLSALSRKYNNTREDIINLINDEFGRDTRRGRGNGGDRQRSRNHTNQSRGFSGGTKMNSNNVRQRSDGYDRIVGNFSRGNNDRNANVRQNVQSRQPAPEPVSQRQTRTTPVSQPTQSAGQPLRDMRNSATQQPRQARRDLNEEIVVNDAPKTSAKITVRNQENVVNDEVLEVLENLEGLTELGLAPITPSNFFRLNKLRLVQHGVLWRVGKCIAAYDINKMEVVVIDPAVLALPPENIDSIPGARRSTFLSHNHTATVKNNDICPEVTEPILILPFSDQPDRYAGVNPNSVTLTTSQDRFALINQGNALYENDLKALEYLRALYTSDNPNKLLLLEEAMYSWYLNDETTDIKISNYLFNLLNSELTSGFNELIDLGLGLYRNKISSFIDVDSDGKRVVSDFLRVMDEYLGSYYVDIITSDKFFKRLINCTFAGYGRMYDEQKKYNENNAENSDYTIFGKLTFVVLMPKENNKINLGPFSATVASGKIIPFTLRRAEVPNFHQLLARINRECPDAMDVINIKFNVRDAGKIMLVGKSLCTGEYIGSVATLTPIA